MVDFTFKFPMATRQIRSRRISTFSLKLELDQKSSFEHQDIFKTYLIIWCIRKFFSYFIFYWNLTRSEIILRSNLKKIFTRLSDALDNFCAMIIFLWKLRLKNYLFTLVRPTHHLSKCLLGSKNNHGEGSKHMVALKLSTNSFPYHLSRNLWKNITGECHFCKFFEWFLA